METTTSESLQDRLFTTRTQNHHQKVLSPCLHCQFPYSVHFHLSPSTSQCILCGQKNTVTPNVLNLRLSHSQKEQVICCYTLKNKSFRHVPWQKHEYYIPNTLHSIIRLLISINFYCFSGLPTFQRVQWCLHWMDRLYLEVSNNCF